MPAVSTIDLGARERTLGNRHAQIRTTATLVARHRTARVRREYKISQDIRLYRVLSVGANFADAFMQAVAAARPYI